MLHKLCCNFRIQKKNLLWLKILIFETWNQRREFSSFCLYFINTNSPSLTQKRKEKDRKREKREQRQLNNCIRINSVFKVPVGAGINKDWCYVNGNDLWLSVFFSLILFFLNYISRGGVEKLCYNIKGNSKQVTHILMKATSKKERAASWGADGNDRERAVKEGKEDREARSQQSFLWSSTDHPLVTSQCLAATRAGVVSCSWKHSLHLVLKSIPTIVWVT